MFAICTIAIGPVVVSAAGSWEKEVVAIVLVLSVSVGYPKMAGIVVFADPISVDQSVVVRRAALEVSRAVAGSWDTRFIIRSVFSPNDTTGTNQSSNTAITSASEQKVYGNDDR